MHYLIQNLHQYRNLWWAEYPVIAGEKLFSLMCDQITALVVRNKELAEEVRKLREENIKLSQRGEN